MKRLLSLVLIFCVIFSCVPAFAETSAELGYHLRFSGTESISDIDSSVTCTSGGVYDSFSVSQGALVFNHHTQLAKPESASSNISSRDGRISISPQVVLGYGSDGRAVYTDCISGKVTLEIKLRYKVNTSGWGKLSDGTSVGEEYFNLNVGTNVSGNVSPSALATQVRFQKSAVTFLNSTSATTSAVTASDKYIKKNVSGNFYSENDCTLKIEYDTEKLTQKISLDGVLVADGVIKSPAKYSSLINGLEIMGLDRMAAGSYFKIISADITTDADYGEMVDILKSLSLGDTDVNNVTSNITLPQMERLSWSSSDENVINSYGFIKRLNGDSADDAVLTASYSDGSVVLKKDFKLKVTGVVGKFWYEQPKRAEDGTYDDSSLGFASDPQNITDAEFFGIWSSQDEKWISKPYLRYSDYPGLSQVELCAKSGDYSGAKSALLSYYRNYVGESRVPETAGTSNDNAKVYFELIKRNAYASDMIVGKALDIFKAQKSEGWTDGVDENQADPKRWSKNYIIDNCVDVTFGIKNAEDSYGELSVMVASVDKYLAPAYIYSKESQYPPVLEVTFTDGSVKEYKCSKDAEISAGTNADKNYGSEKIIKIQEYASGTGVYNDKNSLKYTVSEDFDSNTHRGYFSFDISGLWKEKLKPSSARIKFRCYAPDYGTDEHPYKELVAYWRKDYSWKEDTVCWNTFSDPLYFSENDKSCWDFVTSSNTTVKGKICGYHRANETGKLFSLYMGNKEKENYAYTYLRQYMSYINHVDANPAIINALDMSNDLIYGTQRVYGLINSKHMTPEVFTAYLKHMHRVADHLSKVYYGTATNNWGSYATDAVFLMYARFPECANHDEWRELTKAENDRLTIGTSTVTKPDGMCIELAMGYVGTLLSTFRTPLAAIESIEDFSNDDYPYNDDTLQVLYDCLMTEINMSSPIGGFNIGDSMDAYTSGCITDVKNWYNLVFKNSEKWDSDILKYFATDRRYGSGPYPTTHYPVSMRTFMRSDWSDDALAMSFTAAGEGSHGHRDQLSLAMVAYGKSLLTDQSYGAILTGNTRKYMIAPVQHNLVTINDFIDTPTGTPTSYYKMTSTDGNELGYESNYAYDFVEYGFDGFSEASDAKHTQRSIMFLKNQKMWIVTDYDVPKDMTKQNVFTQHWHMYPIGNSGESPMVWDKTTGILKSRYGSTEPNVILASVGYSDETFSTLPTLYSERGGQLMNNTKGMLQRTKTGSAVFGTVIIPENVGENISVTTAKIDLGNPDEENVFRFEVTNGQKKSKYYYYHINNINAKRESVTLGGYATDADTFLVELDENGALKSVFIFNGTYVKDTKQSKNVLLLKNAGSVSVSYSGDTAEINSSTVFDDETLKNLSVYPNGASSVTLNGGAISGAEITSDGNFGFENVSGISERPQDGNKTEVLPEGKVVYSLKDKNYKSIGDYKKEWTFNEKKPENYAFSVTDDGGLNIENIAENPPLVNADGSNNGQTDTVATVRFDCLFDEDEESGVKTYGKGFSGKYALEFDISQECSTDRTVDTFDTIKLGDTESSSYFLTMRIYNGGKITIVRKGGTSEYISNLGNFAVMGYTRYKIRVEADTVAKTYTVYLNNVKIKEAADIPWEYESGIIDMAVTKMEATKKGSYLRFNDIKIYETERNKADSRYTDVMGRLGKISIDTSDLSSDISLSEYNDVEWTSTNPGVITNSGIITRGDEKGYATLAASAVSSLTPSYSYRREFPVSVLPAKIRWSLSCSEVTDGTVAVSVSNNADFYNGNALLVVSEYDSDGVLQRVRSEKVTGEICDKKYNVTDGTTVKAYLWNNITGIMPLY